MTSVAPLSPAEPVAAIRATASTSASSFFAYTRPRPMTRANAPIGPSIWNACRIRDPPAGVGSTSYTFTIVMPGGRTTSSSARSGTSRRIRHG